MRKRFKTLLLWTLCVVCFLLFYQLANPAPPPRQEYSAFLSDVAAGDAIAEVRIDSNKIRVRRWDGWEYSTLGVVDDEMTQTLSEQGVMIAWGPQPQPFRKLLTVGGPIVLVLALFVYFLKKAQGQTTNALSMRKTTARRIDATTGVSFADVGGCGDAKEHLCDLIDFLDHPDRWVGAGVRLPRGVLLEGPPGCGKTLLARAVAGESKANFYLISASEFVEMFVGVGAARVRDTFETASKNAPAVIFIDELDAVGRRRGSGIGAANDEREQTLNQLLVCMDGFEIRDRVVVIAATNRSDVLDPALLRPGRFDRRIRIEALSASQRREVLAIHTRRMQLGEDLDLGTVAAGTANFSGAELESLVNEAGLRAVRRMRAGGDSKAVLRSFDFTEALACGAEECRRFDCVDALLVESTTQLARPTGKARVRLTLAEGTLVEGELVWADATLLKLRGDGPNESMLVPKQQIRTIEALEGTEWTKDVSPDRLLAHTPELA